MGQRVASLLIAWIALCGITFTPFPLALLFSDSAWRHFVVKAQQSTESHETQKITIDSKDFFDQVFEDDSIKNFGSFFEIGPFLQEEKERWTATESVSHHHAGILLLAVYADDCQWSSRALQIMSQAKQLVHTLDDGCHFCRELPFGKITWSNLFLGKTSDKNGNRKTGNQKQSDPDDDLMKNFLTNSWAATIPLVETGIPFFCLAIQDSNQRTDVLLLPQLSDQINAQELLRMYIHYYYRLLGATDQLFFSQRQSDRAAGNSAQSIPGAAAATSTKPMPLFLGPKTFSNFQKMRQFVCQNQAHVFSNHYPGSSDNEEQFMPPSAPNFEYTTIRDLVENIQPNKTGDFVVFLQCRNNNSNISDAGYWSNDKAQKTTISQHLYDVFSKLHQSMIGRPDILYLSLLDCGKEVRDGTLFAWRLGEPGSCDIDSNNKSDTNDDLSKFPAIFKVPEPLSTQDPSSLSESMVNDLVQFHHVQASPKIMWYDGPAVGAIAFPAFRKVHAFLFVDVHSSQLRDAGVNDLKRLQRALIEKFASICHDWRMLSLVESTNSDKIQQNQTDMVCLIIPSTETRWLTTFGVDPWTAADSHLLYFSELARRKSKSRSNANNDDDGNEEDDFQSEVKFATSERAFLSPPIFLMTDRRRGGLLRYTLDNPTPHAVELFVRSFWRNELMPDSKTPLSSASTITNNYGVHSIQCGGGERFSSLIRENLSLSKHMVILFISPTCGHCKRLLTMFNQLSQVLRRAPGWGDLVGLYTLDVSTQDTAVLNDDGFSFTIRWVPELVYLAPSTNSINSLSSVVQYYGNHKRNILAGDINHWGTLLEWLLHVLDLDEAQLNQLHQNLKQYREELKAAKQ